MLLEQSSVLLWQVSSNTLITNQMESLWLETSSSFYSRDLFSFQDSVWLSFQFSLIKKPSRRWGLSSLMTFGFHIQDFRMELCWVTECLCSSDHSTWKGANGLAGSMLSYFSWLTSHLASSSLHGWQSHLIFHWVHSSTSMSASPSKREKMSIIIPNQQSRLKDIRLELKTWVTQRRVRTKREKIKRKRRPNETEKAQNPLMSCRMNS